MHVISCVLCGLLLAGFILCFYYLLRERPDTEAVDDLGYLSKIETFSESQDTND